MPKRIDPCVRIMQAAKRGKGVVLSASEVWDMHLDDAISTRAAYVQYGPVDDKTGERPGKPETSE
jgi:hypothetical protein